MNLRRWLLLLTVLPGGCVERNLVSGGNILSISPGAQPPAAGDPDDAVTLQVKWLGTACYLIRLGDAVLLTDPFVSHQSAFRAATGTIASDAVTVKAALDGLPVPAAIFISHSHYDHLLDAAEALKQPGWADVPIFGSETTHNILAGYGGPERNVRVVPVDSQWHAVTPHIRYKVLKTEHAIQVPGFPLLYPGTVDAPRTTPPTRAADFQMGGCYNYLFEISSPKLREPFLIHFAAGAAGGDPRGWIDGLTRPPDVAMLCVASWKFVPGYDGLGGYPAGFLQTVKPRNVVLAHFDNFFQVNGREREVVPFAYLDDFLVAAQKAVDYPGFEKIMLPDVGAWMRFRKPDPSVPR